jgi:hypothetical protein
MDKVKAFCSWSKEKAVKAKDASVEFAKSDTGRGLAGGAAMGATLGGVGLIIAGAVCMSTPPSMIAGIALIGSGCVLAASGGAVGTAIAATDPKGEGEITPTPPPGFPPGVSMAVRQRDGVERSDSDEDDEDQPAVTTPPPPPQPTVAAAVERPGTQQHQHDPMHMNPPPQTPVEDPRLNSELYVGHQPPPYQVEETHVAAVAAAAAASASATSLSSAAQSPQNRP